MYVLKQVEREAARVYADVPETLRLKQVELTALDRKIANFVEFIGEGRGSQALASALDRAEQEATALRAEIEGLSVVGSVSLRRAARGVGQRAADDPAVRSRAADRTGGADPATDPRPRACWSRFSPRSAGPTTAPGPASMSSHFSNRTPRRPRSPVRLYCESGPNGNRTRVPDVRGRCPRPLDDGTVRDLRASLPQHTMSRACGPGSLACVAGRCRPVATTLCLLS